MIHDASVLLRGTLHPIVFDVGANEGQRSLAMRAQISGATVIAFEPSPSSLPILRRNLAQTGITIEPLALSSEEGELPFM